MNISEEQQDIIEQGCLKRNIIVSAKAGSGKSTVALNLGKAFYDQHRERTILVTYNNRLRASNQERCTQMNIQDIVHSHTFHSLSGTFYNLNSFGSTGSFDLTIAQTGDGTLQIKSSKKTVLEEIGLVIVDECQDLTDEYYKVVKRVVQDITALRKGVAPVIVLLGDPFQMIYQYKGAKLDYMKEVDYYFQDLAFNKIPFKWMHLSISYRISHYVANFINEHLHPKFIQKVASTEYWTLYGDFILQAWGSKGIQASPDRMQCEHDHPVRIIPNGWSKKDQDLITQMIMVSKPDEVVLLSHSVTSGPMHKYVSETNQLLDWHVTSNDDEDIKQDTTRFQQNKYLVCTIHKFKGSERNNVVYFGYDGYSLERDQNNWLSYYNKHYVACTRAKHDLILVSCNSRRVFDTLVPKSTRTFRTLDVTELFDHVPFDVNINTPDKFISVQPVEFQSSLSSNVSYSTSIVGRSPNTYESIAKYLGLAFELMVEIKSTFCTEQDTISPEDFYQSRTRFFPTPPDEPTIRFIQDHIEPFEKELFKTHPKHLTCCHIKRMFEKQEDDGHH